MAISLIQSAVPATQNVVSPSKAFASNVTAGSLLIAILHVRDATTPQVSDTQGNVWKVAGNPHPGTFGDNTRQTALLYAENAKAGATTVTGTSSGGTATCDMAIAEIGGLTGAGLLEAVTYTFQTTPTTDTSATITTSRSSDAFVVAAACTRDSITAGSSGDGYTIMQDGAGFDFNSSKYKVVSATGSQSAATWANSGTVGTWMVIAAFDTAPAPAAPATYPFLTGLPGTRPSGVSSSSLWSPPAGQLMVYDPAQDDAYDALVIRDMQTTYGAYFKMQEPSGASSLVSRGPLFPVNTVGGNSLSNVGQGPIPKAHVQGFPNRAWRFVNGTGLAGPILTDTKLFSFTGRQNFTAETWVYMDNLPTAFGIGAVFIEKQPGFGWKMAVNPGTGTFFIQRASSVGDSANGPGSGPLSSFISIRQWCHVVGTCDGSNLRLYVNGQLAGSGSITGGDVGETNQGLRFGLNTNGLMSRTAIYGNIVLTPAQILEHSQAGQPGAVSVELPPRAMPDILIGSDYGPSLFYPPVGVTTTPVSAFFDFPLDIAQQVVTLSGLPDEVTQGDRAGTGTLPLEVAQSVAAATSPPVEAGAGVASSGTIPVDEAQAAQSSGVLPLDESQTVSPATAALPLEATQAGITSSSVFPADEGQGVSGSGTFPIDAAQRVATSASLSLESLQAVTATGLLPIDVAQGVASTVAEVVEALQGISSTGVFPVEESGNTPVSNTGSFPIDEAQGVAATAALILEAAMSVASVVGWPVDSAQGIAGTGVFPLDEAQGVSRASGFPIDEALSVAGSGVFPADEAQNVASTSGFPIDEAQRVATAVALVLEALQGVAGTGVFPVEESGNTPVSNAGAFPIDLAQGIASVVVFPIDAYQTGITSSASFPLESTKPVAQVVVVPIESSKGVAGSAVLFVETVAGVRALAVLPIEAPSQFVPDFPGTVVVSDTGPSLVVYDAPSGSVVLIEAGATVALSDGPAGSLVVSDAAGRVLVKDGL